MEKEFAIWLPVDGSEPSVVELKRKEDGLLDLNWCYEKIGCDLVEIVNTIIPHAVLIVDEEGLLKDQPTVNITASILYGALDHGQPIVGAALLCKDEMRPDGLYTVGFPEEDAKALLQALSADVAFVGDAEDQPES